MKLTSITVENYRSITRAHRVAISERTILVGPNNEGKSNILRALVTAMNVLTSSMGRVVRTANGQVLFAPGHRQYYDWDTDFPIPLQEDRPDGESVILLDFRPTLDELEQFRSEIGSKLKDNLPLRICLSANGAKVSVHKKGPGGPALSKKSAAIARFVASRLDFEHIPAVRTAGSAQEIVSTLVERELKKLEADPAYGDALRRIAELQQPSLDTLSASIKQTLVKFLPKVRNVSVQISDNARYRAVRRAVEILVDDGTPTLLAYKGDGVQSLAALALMRHAAETAAAGKNLVIAIEEPESHLHSSAIHEIKDVLAELSQRHQVVLTTHNPLFVDRVRPAANILVSQGKARPARTIIEIREVLGVRASDNLTHAELVLVVEGTDDSIALQALLRHHSRKVAQALENQTLAIDTLGGASNLAYKVGLLRAAICSTHCVLDDDTAARDAYDRAAREGLVTVADVNFITCVGRKEAELEDLYDPAIYQAALANRYRVTMTNAFKSDKKWSERMKAMFKQQGKPWDKIEAEVKAVVAENVAAAPDRALLPACRDSFDALASALEARLDELSAGRRV